MAYQYPILMQLGASNTGLASQIRYRIRDKASADVVASTGNGVIEIGDSTGTYWVTDGVALPEDFDFGYIEVSIDSGVTWSYHAVVDTVLGRVLALPAAAPSVPLTVGDALGWLMLLARNRRTQTASLETVYADDGTTAVATSAVSDDGTTFVRGEYA